MHLLENFLNKSLLMKKLTCLLPIFYTSTNVENFIYKSLLHYYKSTNKYKLGAILMVAKPNEEKEVPKRKNKKIIFLTIFGLLVILAIFCFFHSITLYGNSGAHS